MQRITEDTFLGSASFFDFWVESTSFSANQEQSYFHKGLCTKYVRNLLFMTDFIG